jgi:hypothetical protein
MGHLIHATAVSHVSGVSFSEFLFVIEEGKYIEMEDH